MAMIGPEARKVDHVKQHEREFSDAAVLEKVGDPRMSGDADAASNASGGKRAPSDESLGPRDAKLADNQIDDAAS